MKAVLVILLVAGAFWCGFGYARWYGKPAEKGGRKILYYVDPMHPAYKSDKPGIAPDCGMRLEPVYEDGGSAPAAAAEAPKGKILHYRDPKDPKYTSDKPGLNPETGNDLEPVYEGSAAAMPAGAVQISLEKQQMIGVTYGTVERTGASRSIRSNGKVTLDERLITHVHTRVEGWIDKVFGDFTGKLVEKGQPLATIYSPEMLAAQQELLLARKAKTILHDGELLHHHDYTESLVQAARRKLELWNLSTAQIDEVLRTGEPIRNITIYSPVSGYIVERKAFPNVKVMPDTDLYTIVDLNHVWILADVFEQDAAAIRVGSPAVISLPYEGGRRLTGRVSYIVPQVDPMTRTLKARLEVENPGLRLKPDMFVDVEFQTGFTNGLTVPAEAVLDSGMRKTVFVDRGNGFLEPRAVETGERAGDRVVIVKGLKEGERIVTSGNFLIDSETQLKAAAHD